MGARMQVGGGAPEVGASPRTSISRCILPPDILQTPSAWIFIISDGRRSDFHHALQSLVLPNSRTHGGPDGRLVATYILDLPLHQDHNDRERVCTSGQAFGSRSTRCDHSRHREQGVLRFFS